MFFKNLQDAGRQLARELTVRLSDQLNAIIDFDRTRAVVPLEFVAEVKDGEPTETFPSSV